MHRARLLLLLLLTPLLTYCASDSTTRLSPGQITVSSTDSAQAAKLISRYRATRGLPPVRHDSGLDAAAAEQARAVAATGKLSHGNFSGRMGAYGVPGAAAENLSAGSGDVETTIARWQRSSGHNANLLMPEARRIGLARASTPGAGYGTYWALVLAQ